MLNLSLKVIKQIPMSLSLRRFGGRAGELQQKRPSKRRQRGRGAGAARGQHSSEPQVETPGWGAAGHPWAPFVSVCRTVCGKGLFFLGGGVRAGKRCLAQGRDGEILLLGKQTESWMARKVFQRILG